MSRKTEATVGKRRALGWMRRKLRRAGLMAKDWITRARKFEHDGRFDFKAQYEPHE